MTNDPTPNKAPLSNDSSNKIEHINTDTHVDDPLKKKQCKYRLLKDLLAF